MFELLAEATTATAAVNPALVQIMKGTFLAAVVVLGAGAAVRYFLYREHPELEPVIEPMPAHAPEGTTILPPPLPTLAVPEAPLSPYSPPVSPLPLPAALEAVAVRETEFPVATPGVKTRHFHPLDLLVVGFLFLFFFAQAIATAQMAPGHETKYTPGVLVTAMMFQLFLAGGVTAVMFARVRPIALLGLRWPKWPWALLIGPAGVVVMWTLLFALQKLGYMQWAESLGGAPQDTVKLLKESHDPVVLGLMAFIAVVVAPVCEETIFRGYVYPVTKKFAGKWPAALFSALVFGAAHGNLTALLPLFLLALGLVYLYEKTGSLWAPIAVHMCFNGATVLVQALVRYLDLPTPGM